MQMVKYEFLADGPGPSEQVVGIDTTEGKEEVVLHSSALQRGLIEGGVLGYDEVKGALIEVPRESASGRWRVWVNPSALVTK